MEADFFIVKKFDEDRRELDDDDWNWRCWAQLEAAAAAPKHKRQLNAPTEKADAVELAEKKVVDEIADVEVKPRRSIFLCLIFKREDIFLICFSEQRHFTNFCV